MSSTQNTWIMLGAVVVGVVSAAGLIIAEHLRQDRRRHAMAADLARLNQQITGLQGQMEVLTKQQQHTVVDGSRVKRRFRSRERTLTSTTTTTDDYNSALDSSDMEFYDVSDDESSSRASTITPLDVVLKDIDQKLEDPAQLRTAFAQLESLLFDYPASTEVLWRIGKARHRMANEIADVPAKMVHLGAGIESCKQALEINPQSGEAHKWCAILLGSRTNHQGIRDKVRDGMEFKAHIDRAIELLPEDATLLFLLGRYTLAVASLNWFERKTVGALFEALPTCTHQEALDTLLEAHRIGEPDWKENKLSIAKCYVAQGDYKEALKWLDEAHAIQKAVVDEEGIDQEIQALINKYNSYR